MEKEGRPCGATGRRGSLVLFPGALGDAVCLEPSIAWLSARGPVTVWARGGAAEVAGLFAANPTVGSIDRAEVARFFAPAEAGADGGILGDYDRVVSFTGAESAPLRARFAAAGNGEVYRFPSRIGAGHAADEMLAAVSGGDARVAAIPHLPSPAAATAGRLVLHPGSGGAKKRAPRELFAEIATRWTACPGATAEVLLGPAEAAERRWWEAHGGSVVEPRDVAELTHRLARAEIYVGNDSGPSHVAAALGVRSVILFVAADPQRFAQRGARVTLVRLAPVPSVEAVWRSVEAGASLTSC